MCPSYEQLGYTSEERPQSFTRSKQLETYIEYLIAVQLIGHMSGAMIVWCRLPTSAAYTSSPFAFRSIFYSSMSIWVYSCIFTYSSPCRQLFQSGLQTIGVSKTLRGTHAFWSRLADLNFSLSWHVIFFDVRDALFSNNGSLEIFVKRVLYLACSSSFITRPRDRTLPIIDSLLEEIIEFWIVELKIDLARDLFQTRASIFGYCNYFPSCFLRTVMRFCA